MSDQEVRKFVARPVSSRLELEAILAAATDDWTEGYVIRGYSDDDDGRRLQTVEAGILAAHGYLTQSSDVFTTPAEVGRVRTLMVAYVGREEARLYDTLRYPGVVAAGDYSESFWHRREGKVVRLILVVVFLVLYYWYITGGRSP